MEVGVEVWLRDTARGWMPSVVKSREGNVLVVCHEGTDAQFILGEGDTTDHEDIKLRNDHTDASVEDLINLPHLHEPAILYCLEQRYNNGNIYTCTGPILIAVNPFKHVPLYSTQILESYYNAGLLRSQGIDSPGSLPPHIYAVADAAFRDMMTVISAGHFAGENRDKSANQCILISGESGAGKSESTKIVLRYLTTVGNSTGGTAGIADGSVMDKVLRSNPILEAFGNAKTIRNDNSSRFGKFIELNFSKRGHLIGGTIRTYLLEKVRLPVQQTGERNFHVFYQMLAGASGVERQSWGLTDASSSAENLFYTNQGGVYELRNVNDKDEYADLRRALNTLNFDNEDQETIFMSLAGVLHLGQLGFVPDEDGEGCELSKSGDYLQESASHAARLLGILRDALIKALTTRVIATRDEQMEKRLTVREAIAARDALSKAIYGRLFNWIVQTINRSIQVDSSFVRADIGVLDIFGFECFKSNSFEQLCINYTNETLQQQFNQFVFKMEQQEYKREQIEWSFISFPDNQDCLELIENKATGILAMIDDECRLPKATDEKLAARMYKALDSHPRFSATAPLKRNSKFCIKHYAGPVVYCAISFVEKNKDELPKEAVSLMSTSSHVLLKDIFVLDQIPDYTLAQPQSTQVDKTEKKMSVGAQFKTQLATLMDKICETKPHYIRCLKPNDLNVPDSFNRVRTTEQLRYGGVLEAVRVARSGFPVRLGHADFYSRYRPLSNPFDAATAKLPRSVLEPSKDAKVLCEKLVTMLLSNEDVYSSWMHEGARNLRKIDELLSWLGKHDVSRESVQLGISKVFLRKEAHDLLEARRARRLAGAAKCVQSVIRRQHIRRWYIEQLWALRFLQRVGRGMMGRIRARILRAHKGAVRIQTSVRMHTARWKFGWFMYALTTLQSRFRGKKSRYAFREHFYNIHRTKLFRCVCTLLMRRRFLRTRRGFVLLQCRFRQRVAKDILKRLRFEARDLGKLKQSNDALKAEIELLRTRAREGAKEQAMLAEQKELQRLTAEQKGQLEKFVKELESTKAMLESEQMRCRDLQELVRQKDAQLNEVTGILNGSTAHIRPPLPMLCSQGTSPRNSFASPRESIPASDSRNPGSLALGLSIDEEVLRELDEEKRARLHLEEEVARLRRISMDLTNQMDAFRRVHGSAAPKVTAPFPAAASTIPLTAGGGSSAVNRRPDENPHRRRPQFSTTTAQPSKSLQAVDLSKKVGLANLIHVKEMGSGNEIDSLGQNTDSELGGAEPPDQQELPVGDEMNVLAQEQKNKRMLDTAAAAATWNKNLGNFKLKLQQGVFVNLWEGDCKDKFETKMRLNSANNTISFEFPKKKTNWGLITSYLGAKEELAAIKVSDVFDCFSFGNRELLENANSSSWAATAQNNSTFSDNKNEQTLLTLICQSEGTQAARKLCMQLPTKEERNFLVSGFRMLRESNPLVSQQCLRLQTKPSQPSRKNSDASPSLTTSSNVSPFGGRRRLTRRDAAIETAIEESRSRKSSEAITFLTYSHGFPASEMVHTTTLSGGKSSMSLQSQLQDERINNERLRTQCLLLQNELHELHEEVVSLKKERAVIDSTMKAKSLLYEQDAHVRMQIGQKLEQTICDREELREINVALQAEILDLKHRLTLPLQEK